MAQDPQLDTLPLGTSWSGTRDDHHDFGKTVVADRFYGHDGPTGVHWQGREEPAFGYFPDNRTFGGLAGARPAGIGYTSGIKQANDSGYHSGSPGFVGHGSRIAEADSARGRVNEVMVGLVNRYPWSSAYIAFFTFLAIMSEVAPL